MKYFAKCVAVFIGLTILFMLLGEYVLNAEIVFSGTFLLSSFAALLCTILFGWIDSVYIQKREPGL
jgi:hypothetical protein